MIMLWIFIIPLFWKIIITMETEQVYISGFLEVASMKLPSVIIPANEDINKREVYDDYATMSFTLQEPMSIRDLLNLIDESAGLIELYYHMRSRQTDFGHSVCIFQEAGTGPMFKLNASTEGDGKLHYVDVTVYTSMEIMSADVIADAERVQALGGEYVYKITVDEAISFLMS